MELTSFVSRSDLGMIWFFKYRSTCMTYSTYASLSFLGVFLVEKAVIDRTTFELA
jgi:hypothetical protein